MNHQSTSFKIVFMMDGEQLEKSTLALSIVLLVQYCTIQYTIQYVSFKNILLINFLLTFYRYCT